MATSSNKKITLTSSDGKTYEVEEVVAFKSQMIKHMVENDCSDNVIPLPKVNSSTLAKVLEYCEKHVGGGEVSAQELENWDNNYVNVDQRTLFNLVIAANYLDIKSLLDLTSQAVADMIKDLTPEEVRKVFNIPNDFAPEEEEELRRQNQWAFQ